MRGQVHGSGGQVDHAHRAARAPEREYTLRRGQPVQRTVAEPLGGAAQTQGLAVQREHRRRVRALAVRRVRRPALRLRQPGLGLGAEPAVRRVGGPGQGHTAAVPSRVDAPGAEVHRVLDALARDVGLGQAQFLPLVQVDGPGQGQRQQRGGPRAPGAQGQVGRGAEGLLREVEPGVLAAVPGHRAGHVVVAQHPGGRGADGRVLGQGVVDGATQPVRLPGAGEEVEVEGGVQFVGAQVPGEALGVGQPHLADEDAPELVGDPAPGAVDVVQLVLVDVGVRVDALHEVRERRVLREQGRGVDAYARHPALEPEPQHVLVLPAHLRMGPVQVGLLRGEQVQVPLAVRDPGPGPAGELRGPVVGRQFAVLAAAGAEVEPLPFRAARAGLQRRPEPGVLVGDVVGDDVDDGADAQLPRLGDQLLGLAQGAERGVDGAVVGDVVAAVDERGDVPGGEPDGVHAEFGEVGQSRPHTREVTGAVAVAVGETAGIHLVDDGVAPPVVGALRVGGCHVTVLSGRVDLRRRPGRSGASDGPATEVDGTCCREAGGGRRTGGDRGPGPWPLSPSDLRR